MSCGKFLFLGKLDNSDLEVGSFFDNLLKIFENDFFTEKHNDGNSTSNAKNNKCWKKIFKKFDNKV